MGSPKTIVGVSAGMHGQAQHGLVALDRAVKRQFQAGGRDEGLSLMSDTGCRPTSTAFMRACGIVGIPQALTRDNKPKGHADTERVMRTLKEACLGLTESTCPFELSTARAAWIADDHEHDLHSALGDKPPSQFEREYHTRHSPQFVVV